MRNTFETKLEMAGWMSHSLLTFVYKGKQAEHKQSCWKLILQSSNGYHFSRVPGNLPVF